VRDRFLRPRRGERQREPEREAQREAQREDGEARERMAGAVVIHGPHLSLPAARPLRVAAGPIPWHGLCAKKKPRATGYMIG
jgi:hypothetical protein